MDFTRLDNRLYLNELFNEPPLLIQEINDTKGFVLEKLKEARLLPPINLLLENLSPFTIQFLINNYSFNKEQNNIVIAFISDDARNNLELKNQNIEYCLNNGISLAKNTVLTFNQINEFTDEILSQTRENHYEMEAILSASIKPLPIEQMLSLNDNFLDQHIRLFNRHPSYFNDSRYNSLYKEKLLNSKEDDKPTLMDFQNCHFSTEEKDLVLSLLKNSNSFLPSYGTITNISGIKQLITKDEYFLNFKAPSLQDYSDTEVANRKDFFQTAWLAKGSASFYNLFGDFLYNQATPEQFETIMDEGFITTVLKEKFSESDSIFFRSDVDTRDNYDLLKKNYFLHSGLLNILVKDETLCHKVELMNILSTIELLQNNREQPKKGDYSQLVKQNQNNIQHFFSEIFPNYLVNDKVGQVYSNLKLIFNPVNLQHIDELSEKNPTINLFYGLCLTYKALNSNNFFMSDNYSLSMGLEKTIAQMYKTIKNEDTVTTKMILESLSGVKKTEFINDLLTDINSTIVSQQSKSNSHNIFVYEGNDLTALPSVLWSYIYSVRPEFSKEINCQGITAPDEFLRTCLKDIENPISKDFLREYAVIHREEIEKNTALLNLFLSSPQQTEIFPEVSTQRSHDAYNYFLKLLIKEKNVEQLIVEHKEKYPNTDLFYSRQGLGREQIDIVLYNENQAIELNTTADINVRHADLYCKSNYYQKCQKEQIELMSFEFLSKQVTQLVTNKDFSTLQLLNEKKILKPHYNKVVQYINQCDYSELMSNTKNSDFITLLKSGIEHNHKTDIVFKQFTMEESGQVAQSLLPSFTKDKIIDYNMFYFFEDKEFIKDFSIKHFPSDVFYHHEFFVGHHKTGLVPTPYSNEQIYQAYQSLEKTTGFFSETNVNADYTNFLGANFFSRGENEVEHQKSQLNNFLDLVSFAKDNDPKFYLLLANYQIFSNAMNWDINKTSEYKPATRDESINLFFKENFNIDVILQGFREIISDMKNNYQEDIYEKTPSKRRFNKKLAANIITRVINNTYYQSYEKNTNREYLSHTEQQDTIKIINFFFNEAPTFLIDRYVIGQATNPVQFFKEHSEHFVNYQSVEKFLFPQNHLIIPNLNLYDNEQQKSRLIGITEAIIENCIEKNDRPTIHYMDYMIKQFNFIKKEVGYKAKNKVNSTNSDIFIQCLAQDNNISQLLDKALFKMNLDNNLAVKDHAPKIKRKKI